jgi:hypothetical protein
MNRSSLVRLVLAVACAAGPGSPRAQQGLEIIALRHRTVEQVLPVLQPLVEPGGTLSGTRGQLFLRASPTNVAEIKRALEAIDRPAKRLQISVRFDDEADSNRRELAARGTISNRSARIGVTAEESRSSAGERVDQRLQVLEGGRATIFAGRSDLVRDMASGFEVLPRIAADQVVLEIVQQRETPGPRGSIRGERIVSTVTTRLGEWTEIGGAVAQAGREERAIASARSERTGEARRVWVKVEELPN